MRRASTTAILLLATFAPAQEATATPRLVEVGRAHARGDGTVERCLFTADSSRMLTVGAEGDLVWWDLHERRPLRHVDPPDAPIRTLRLHPDEAWIACEFEDGSGLRIDLTTGNRQPWSAQQVASLQPPANGDWLTGGAAVDRWQTVVSANGLHKVHLNRRVPPTPGQFLHGERLWLANDGTAVEARGTRLRLHGLEYGDVTEHRVHCGPPQRLVFTPDANHLAIVGLDATQIVDVAGNEIAHLEGSRIVQPGPGPDEFWLLTADSMRRWSATRRDHVGDAITWPGRNLRLQVDDLHGNATLRHALVRGGQPWTPEFARLPDGSFRAVAFARQKPTPRNGMEQYEWLGPPETTVAFVATGDAAAPMLLTSAPGDRKFTRARATLRRLGDDGATTHHAAFDAAALWLATATGGTRVTVGLANGTVQAFDSAGLTPLANASFDPPLVAAVALGAGHLLASTGKKLLRLDAATLAVVDELPLPEGLRGADRLLCSTDGRHLAIANGSDVRILRID